MSLPKLRNRVTVGESDEAVCVLQAIGTGRLRGTISFDEELPSFIPVNLSLATFGDRPDEEVIRCTRGAVARGDRFEVEGLCAGDYHVRVHHYDHQTRESIMGYGTVRITEGEVAEVHIELERKVK